MNRVFRRESTTCQDPASTAMPEPKTGQLFGRSLTDLCEDGNLPMSILVSFIWDFSSCPEHKNTGGLHVLDLSYHQPGKSLASHHFEQEVAEALKTFTRRITLGLYCSHMTQSQQKNRVFLRVAFSRNPHGPAGQEQWALDLTLWVGLCLPCSSSFCSELHAASDLLYYRCHWTNSP